MKKVLSFILAMALTFSFAPNLFASAAEEEAAQAETISYKISSNSVKEGAFEGTHYLPVVTDEASENYGKLALTKEEPKDSGTYVPIFVEPTTFNVISNLSGEKINYEQTTTIAGDEFSLVTYRTVDYYNGKYDYGNKFRPIRKIATTGSTTVLKTNLTFGSSWGVDHNNYVPYVYTIKPTLDLSKTAPFELFGRSKYSKHGWLESTGYDGTFTTGTSSDPDANLSAYGTVNENHFTVRIKIPETGVEGKYTVKVGNNFAKNATMGYYTDPSASKTDVYITKIDPEVGFEGGFYPNGGNIYQYYPSTVLETAETANATALDRSAYADDENFLGTYMSTGETSSSFEKELTFAPGEEYIVYFRMSKDSLKEDASNAHLASGAYYQNFKLSYIDLVPVDADYDKSFDATMEENYTTGGTATVNAYTYTDKENSYSLNNTVALGGTYSAAAPEIEGYHFLYWAKGASSKKQIVSYEKSFNFKPHEGANYLVAVYEKDGEETAKAEFYNANGDLIATLTADGKAPELPTLAGYGNASGWVLYGDSTKTEYAENSDISVSGTMIFVANYANNPATVTINEKDYAYGDLVTLTAKVPEGQVFKGWKKNGEIVSVSTTYSFYAYKTCTVEPIYAPEEPNFSGKFIKIFIDTFSAGDETAIMAEFIGLSDAVEKGIIVNGTHKLAMKSDASQFTVTADVDGTYEGYAIVKDGASYTQVKDGSAEVK